MNPTDDPAYALIKRTNSSGHGNAETPPAPLDLTDPDIIRGFLDFNAGVARAKNEYAMYPFLRSQPTAPPMYGQRRTCPECGDLHKSKRSELCWRCIGPKS